VIERGGSLFQHGVASGDPTPRRVVIWTRVTAPPGRTPTAAFWRVLEADTGRMVANGQTRVRAEADATVRVDVGGLSPDSRYTYDFEVDGEPSPQGRTRTLPEGDVASIRFGQVSCAKYNAGHFNAYARLAERDDLAFLLHLGDWIYEASQTPPASQTASKDIGRPFDPLHECKTLDDYRMRYAQYRRDPDVQAISAALPVISTVDDHEFADGAWREGATEHKPGRDGPWSERRANAFRAREEWLPVRRPDMASPERVYRSIQIGSLAELFMLDTRTMRDEPVPPPASGRKGRTALGPEQKAWLYDALRASRARWRLLGNPSVMSRTWNDSLPAAVREALVKVKLIDADGTGPDYDQWDGYPHERRELLDVISKLPQANTVVLSGDVHVGLAAELAETPSEPPVAVEFVNTSLTSQNLDDKMGWGLRTESVAIERALLAGMPHMRYVDLDSHGFSIVDLDREELRFEWWTVDALETRSPGQVLSATVAVRHGEPRLIGGAEPATGAMAPATPRRRTPAGSDVTAAKPRTRKGVAAKAASMTSPTTATPVPPEEPKPAPAKAGSAKRGTAKPAPKATPAKPQGPKPAAAKPATTRQTARKPKAT
jgi:alkaline phosphatase D